MDTDPLDSLRSQWSTLYTKTLPKLAQAKDPAQPIWPVKRDHCFARIILDNTIGNGVVEWDFVIKRPAIKHMNEEQFKEAIHLAEEIRTGKVDLVDLDNISLVARNKDEKEYPMSAKRGRQDNGDSTSEQNVPTKRVKMRYVKKAKPKEKTQSTLAFAKKTSDETTSSDPQVNPARPAFPNPNSPEILANIQKHSGLTPYRKLLYSTLLSVPAGRYTTYQAMATFLGSSARAIGNGMRNNPFAPGVPCHRVLASDGTIGGFYGSWGEEGKYAQEKRDLLKSEGVVFDSKGKVKGPVFRDFEDLSRRQILESAEA